MQNLNLKKESLLFVIISIAVLVFAFFYKQFPEKLPIHFNFLGQPNNFKTPLVTLAIYLAIQVAIYFVLLLSSKPNQPEGQNPRLNNNYFGIRLIIHSFIAIIFTGFFLDAAQIFSINPFKSPFMSIVISMFFMSMGYCLNEIRPNNFVGIRTPWTMKNEEVWQKTHHLASKLWGGAGVVGILLALVLPSPISLPITIELIALTSIIAVVYSYIEYKKITKAL